MAQNVGTAKVTIEADLSQFQKDLDTFFSKSGKSAGSALDSGVKSGAESAKKSAEGVADSAVKATSDAGKAFSGVPKAAGSAGEQASQQFSSGVSGVVDATRKAAENAGKSMGGVASTAAKAGADSASRFGQGISGVTSSTSKAAEASSRSLSGITSSAAQAAARGSQAWSNAGAAIQSAVTRASANASAALSSTASSAQAAAGKIRSSLTEAFDAGGRAAGALPGKLAGLGVALAGVAGPAVAIKGGFDRLMNIQRAEIVFKNIGLSADETAAQMAQLTEQVTGTSVSLSDAAKYSGMFAQAGVELGAPMNAAIDAFTALSTIAEGSGVDVGRVLAQISANGKVTGEDLMQMSDAGVNATKYLADSMGMSQADVKKAVSDGKVSFQQFVDAVNQGTGTLAKDMGETLPAKLSNFSTAMSSLGAAVIEPFIGPMTTVVTVVTSGLKTVTGAFKDFMAFLSSGSAQADAVKGVLMGVVGAITAFVLPAFVSMAAGWATALVASGPILALKAFIGTAVKFWASVFQTIGILALYAAQWVRTAAVAVAQATVAAGAWLIAAPKNLALWAVGFAKIAAGWVAMRVKALVEAGRAAVAWVIAAPKNPIVWAQAFGAMIAGWARASAAAMINAGRIAAAWVIAAPKNAALAVKALALMAAGWVKTAATAMINAAVMAGAWLIAMWPVALVVGAIAGVVLVFVTLWNKVEGFRNFWQAVWDGIVAGVTVAWNWIRDTIIGVWDSIVSWFQSGGVQALWGSIVDGAQVAWDFVVTLWNGAVEFFGGVFSGIWTVVSTAWTAISDVFMWAWNTVLSPIYTWIAETWGKIWDLLGPAWDAISAKIGEFGTWFSGFWNETLWPLLSKVIGFFQELGQKIGQFVSEHWSVLKPILIALGVVLLAPIVVALGLVVGAIVAVIAIVGVVIGAITGFIYVLVQLPGKIMDAVRAIGDWFTRAWQWVQDAFNRMGAAVSGWWNDHVAPLPGQVGNAIGGVMDWFGSLPGKVKSALGDAGQWLVSAGKDIIQGLINGLSSAIGGLMDKVGSIAGSVKDKFTGLLGINSPSRVFTEYGVFIGQGLARGLDQSGRVIDAAAERMADRVSSVQITAPTVAGVEMPEVSTSSVRAVSSAPVSPSPSAAPSEAPGGVELDPSAVSDPSGAFTTAATTMASTAESLLTPMWAQQNMDMTTWGLTAQTQATTMVTPALSAVGLAASTMNLTQWQPAMLGMNTAVTGTGLTTMTQANTVINPALSSVGLTAWNVLNGSVAPATAGMNGAVVNTANITRAQTSSVMNPALNSVGATSWNVLNGSVNPAMAGMRGAVANTADSFRVGADNIAAQWNRVREATAQPARFAIQSVFNDGIVGMWNSVSDLLGTQKMAAYPVRFATGGYVRGPGGPTADKIPALLSDREFVINAKATKAIGPENLAALNSGRYQVASGVLKDPSERKAMLQDRTFRHVAARYQGGGLAEGTPAWRALLRGYNWARSRNGRPYVWGGSANGSGGADCSGFMSGIADVILGGDGARQWATGNFPGTQAGAWAPGLSAGFSVGIVNGGPWGGHTAGTIGGVPGMPAVNVEAGGANSRVKFGTPDAAGANDPQFPAQYHLRYTDAGVFVPGQGSGASMSDIIGGLIGPMQEKLKSKTTGWAASNPGIINTMPEALRAKMTEATQAKIDKLLEEMMADPGGSGAERWRPMAKRAMARVGFDYTNPAQVNAMIAQIQSESGGNPGIMQNGYVDVNTGGNEAVGLLQVTKGTWAAFRDPELPDDRTNPFANMVGALRYYKATYGMDLTTMWGHGHGYDKGGEMIGPGLFAKKTTDAERVLSPRQTRAFDELVDVLSGPGWDDFVRGTGGGSSTVESSSSRVINAPVHFHGPVGTTEAADKIHDTIVKKAW